MLMDRAYEGDETRQLALSLGMIPVVPPKSNRIEPWEYDRALYKKRNEIDCLFRRLKGFRRSACANRHSRTRISHDQVATLAATFPGCGLQSPSLSWSARLQFRVNAYMLSAWIALPAPARNVLCSLRNFHI